MVTAFVFPGQGSQAVGMGKDWLGRSDLVRGTFDEADEALGVPLSRVILDGPIEELTKTEHTQPALLTVSVAYARVLAAEGIAPAVVAGHSLGEYSALVTAGSLAFGDAVRLTRLRGQAMQSAVPIGVGTMAALIGIDDDAVVAALCAAQAQGEVVEPAGFNAPGQVVVAGHVGAVRRVVEAAKDVRGMGRELNVSAPFHCSLLEPAGRVLDAALREVAFAPLAVPYVPNVTGEWTPSPSPDDIRRNLVVQVSKPVLWTPSVRAMVANGVTRFIEVGAGRTLVGLIKRFDRKADADAFEAETWKR